MPKLPLKGIHCKKPILVEVQEIKEGAIKFELVDLCSKLQWKKAQMIKFYLIFFSWLVKLVG